LADLADLEDCTCIVSVVGRRACPLSESVWPVLALFDKADMFTIACGGGTTGQGTIAHDFAQVVMSKGLRNPRGFVKGLKG
jgi:hypothetical protein